MKQSVLTFKKMKEDGKKISMLTAYDYSTAKLMDEAGIHGILVGDSLGNVMLGYEDTIPVTMQDMITFGSAVSRGAKNALVVIDLPFMSYQISTAQALENAGRLMKEAGADAVKLEGGASVCPQIKVITDAGIPVMAHIGLTPQSVNVFGGFKIQGKSREAALKLIEDAKNVEEAGAFAVVLEGIPSSVAEIITNSINIPTIGIGAGAECDGQILVNQDMFGMFSDFTPKFVKRYAEIGKEMKRAIADYMEEVEDGVFPAECNQYKISDDIMLELRKEVEII
ncbi:3-methyl-2-oxobutanoate hydroxymethyltransferase [Anaerotignum sp. MSJ-24]|uniref:3-methyl-2-oxobutanoate hydroxymethyltransferase n=1 Tax=Anaerotignum sp. MSJ-24 TaxID=2841521 RepID=UPI001C1232A6|nr:3-methyl-2-oxobutanoate hydroxymethyltransferase [Anaerotignum sp. MSJ-24]MBU5463496.1 3-methyl-2-oxobutanoate hydroxymethyltransferase [Anaerotignum sp. MSJ-24]